RVVSGDVRVAVEKGDGLGNWFVATSEVVSDPETTSILFGGLDLGTPYTAVRLIAEASGGPAEFVWDAATLTLSPTAWPLAPLMGASSLWAAARRELAAEEGGLGLVVGFEGEVVDLAAVGLAADAVHLG